ncbi:hypothetical protein HAX54_030559, partial [Datura stramonium]|nr:hypothetical protein [Datura stramonium]
AMASHANKGKEVATSSKGFKRLRRFGAKAMEEHGLEWFNAHKENKYVSFNAHKENNYVSENWIDEGHLALEFPIIHDRVEAG